MFVPRYKLGSILNNSEGDLVWKLVEVCRVKMLHFERKGKLVVTKSCFYIVFTAEIKNFANQSNCSSICHVISTTFFYVEMTSYSDQTDTTSTLDDIYKYIYYTTRLM